MSPLALLALQIAMTFLALGLLARWVVQPAMARWPTERALRALLWVHVFRYVPLALYAPGQVSPDVSPLAVHTIAWGDFASSLLALLALAMLQRRNAAGLPWVWAFSIISCLDIVAALAVALSSGVHEHPLGVSWFVLILYVPLVCVSQLLLLVRLRGSRS